MERLTFEGSLGDLEELPVSRSITVPRKPADTFRATTGRGHVRKTRTVTCTLMGGLLQPCSL